MFNKTEEPEDMVNMGQMDQDYNPGMNTYQNPHRKLSAFKKQQFG